MAAIKVLPEIPRTQGIPTQTNFGNSTQISYPNSSTCKSIKLKPLLVRARDDRNPRRNDYILPEEKQWQEVGTEAKGWDLQDKPQVYWFAIANANSLMLHGPRLEEILGDAVDRANREKRERDVWLVVEPAFLEEHPGLAQLKATLEKPTAAIVSTNAGWMVSVCQPLLPQAIIGKFKAPSVYVKNPLKSAVKAADAIIGGGGVWH